MAHELPAARLNEGAGLVLAIWIRMHREENSRSSESAYAAPDAPCRSFPFDIGKETRKGASQNFQSAKGFATWDRHDNVGWHKTHISRSLNTKQQGM